MRTVVGTIYRRPLSCRRIRNFPRLACCLLALLLAPLDRVSALQPANQENDEQAKLNPAEIRDLIYSLDEAESALEIRRTVDSLKSLPLSQVETLRNPPQGLRKQTRLLLEKIVNEIQTAALKKELSPTRVTVVGNFTLGESLALLQKQGGHQFRLDEELDQTARRIEIRNLQYWVAFDQILNQFNAVSVPSNAGSGMRIRPRSETGPDVQSGRVTYADLLRIEPLSMRSFRQFDDPALYTDSLELRFQWEPKFQPFEIKIDRRKIKAKDSAGKPVQLKSTDRVKIPITASRSFVDLDFLFPPLDSPPRKLKLISGEVQLTVPVRQHRFLFADVFNKGSINNRSSRQANSLVEILKAEHEDKRTVVRVRYQVLQADQAFESHQGWMFRNKVFLKDDAGRELFPEKMTTLKQERQEIQFEFLFPKIKADAKWDFHYRCPTGVETAVIPFEIKDLEFKSSDQSAQN